MAGDCTTETCPVEGGYVSYKPSVGGNAFFLAAFATLVPVVVGLGLRFRTLAFSAVMVAGILLEVLGFLGRLLLKGNRARQEYFILYLIGTVVGPSLFAQGVFMILPRIIAIHGERTPKFRASHVLLVFSSLAGLVVVIEVAGVVSTVLGANRDSINRSANVLVVGLAVQLGALILFMAVHVWFTLGLQRIRTDLDTAHADIYRSPKFKLLLPIMQSAVVLLLATTLFRIVEIGTGLDSALAQNEPALMTIAGGLPLLVAIILTAFHPGVAFGRDWGRVSSTPATPRYMSQRQGHSAMNSPAAPYEPAYMPRPVQEVDTAASVDCASSPSASFSTSPSASTRVFKYQQVAPRPLEGIGAGSLAGKKSPGSPPYELFRTEGKSPHFSPEAPGMSPSQAGMPAGSQRSSVGKPASPRKLEPTKELVDGDAIWC